MAAETNVRESGLRKRDDGLHQVQLWKCKNGEGNIPPGGALSSDEGRATSAPLPSPGGRRLKLLWASQLLGIGPAFGWQTHADNMRRALAAAGVEISYDRNSDATLAVSIVPTDLFDPLPGKLNLLFCTAEMSEASAPLAAKPDVLVVPCQHNKDLFSQCFDGPIHVCPEGVNATLFPHVERHAPSPGEPWKFLFVGNVLENTKGCASLVRAWDSWRRSGNMPSHAQLLIKASGLAAPLKQFYTVLNGELLGPLPDPLPTSFPGPLADRVQELPKSIVILNRKVSVQELRAIYEGAHCLVSPSEGDAWNLVLCEAMSSGLPSVFSLHTATLDYADASVGFPLTNFRKHVFWEGEPNYYGLAPEESDIIGRMEEVVEDYSAALARGRAASERMKSYSWEAAAERFIEICSQCVGAGV